MTTHLLKATLDAAASGDPDAPLVVLGPSLGTTTSLWDRVVPALTEHYRVLRFDLPGHGFGPVARGPFQMADLADAVIALVDSVGGGSVRYAGISLGGAVGLELAIRHPARVSSLVVICSAARIGAPQGWRDRAAQIRSAGTGSVIVGSAERWFAPGFLDRDPGAGAAALEHLLDVDDESYALCCDALAAFDVTDEAARITADTLCVSGGFDLATPSAQLQELADAIPGARHETIAGVAHLPAIERPEVLAALLVGHFAGASAAPQVSRATSAYDAGMIVRREVLGDKHVDAATAAITPETADFQEFITKYAWGEIWTRPALDRRTRSFLTIASLVTGGHGHELAMHVRAALTNGLTRAEIAEAIMHTAIYAGVPAANSAMGIARDTFAALDAPRPPSPTRGS